MPAPVRGKCNWTPVGPGPVPKGQTVETPWIPGGGGPVSGRVRAIAIDPNAPSNIYIGTAAGGIWKSTDGGETWSPKTDYAMSLSIGALAIDPKDSSRIVAGTGEYGTGTGTYGLYYGNGILKSEDSGETWDELATSFFEHDEITRIIFDPTDPFGGQWLFLSSATGVYASNDGGDYWGLLRAGSASDLVLLVSGSAPTQTRRLIAAFVGSGLWTATQTGGGSWSAWTQIESPAVPTSITDMALSRIVLGQARDNPTTIYAAFAGLGGLSAIARTTDGGDTWESIIKPATPFIRADFAFVIAAHPTDPDTVYCGSIFLFRSTNAGADWADITNGELDPPPEGIAIGIHADQHAFAFDPNDSDTIWSGNDGGVFRSTDAGTTWTHRNRDLATLQYNHVSMHPKWESVMLGGTQDNGTHRYSGNPAWEFSAGGDGGYTAIDPVTPTRMYRLSMYHFLDRSESAGAWKSWAPKFLFNDNPGPDDEFYPPFALDPQDPSVAYIPLKGKLYRMTNFADNYDAVTTHLDGGISAIAVHPTDSDIVYAGTNTGHVYRVQRVGATWDFNSGDVTTTELAGGDLPAGLYISDLAVDTAGNVWATVSSIQWTEATGEFSNSHVFRFDGTEWENRSNGLALANPINTIVIDPADESRLFCGGDIGVFRTENAGLDWEPWDEGLPNAPVFHLALHAERRLLRAATFGRSVWERPIDVDVCPMVDLYVRDNILDTGRFTPSPEQELHPFEPTKLVYHWHSADIKVDAMEKPEGQPNLPPAFQTPTPVEDYVFFESALQHRTARRGQTNRFYVQVHNRGVSKASNVQVRAFFAEGHAGLPPLPANFWSPPMPFAGTPSGPDWTAVANAHTFAELEPGEPGVKEWDFVVPSDAYKHSCLLVVTTCAEDPLTSFPFDKLVRYRKQVALKNLQVEDAVMGAFLLPDEAFVLQFRSPYPHASLGDVLFQWGNLPRETQLFVAFERLPGGEPAVRARPGELKRGGVAPARGRERLFRERLEGRSGEIRRFDLKRIYRLSRSSDRTTVIPSVWIPHDRSLAMAMNFMLPKNSKRTPFQFDVIQRSGKQNVGGCTYLLRPRRQTSGRNKN